MCHISCGIFDIAMIRYKLNLSRNIIVSARYSGTVIFFWEVAKECVL